MNNPTWRTVWVTGASSGIGAAFVRLLSDSSATIAASARSEQKLGKLASDCAQVMAYPLDVTDAQAVATSVESIETSHGPIDLAVLNAGTWSLMDVVDFDPQSVRRGIEVNYIGVINALHAVLPGMLDRGRGHIAITASVSGYRGLPKAIAYGPTKAALISLAETLRCELSPRGITVSLINPGFVDTPMTRDNPFPMPSLISSEQAAQYMLEGLQRGRYEIAFPRRFAFAMKCLRILPNNIYFWVVRRFIMKG